MRVCKWFAKLALRNYQLGWKKKKKEARTRDNGTDLTIPLSFVFPSVRVLLRVVVCVCVLVYAHVRIVTHIFTGVNVGLRGKYAELRALERYVGQRNSEKEKWSVVTAVHESGRCKAIP